MTIESMTHYSGSAAIDALSVANCDSRLALCAPTRRSMSPVVNWRVWTRAASRAPTRAPISDRRFTISNKIGFMPKTIPEGTGSVPQVRVRSLDANLGLGQRSLDGLHSTSFSYSLHLYPHLSTVFPNLRMAVEPFLFGALVPHNRIVPRFHARFRLQRRPQAAGRHRSHRR